MLLVLGFVITAGTVAEQKRPGTVKWVLNKECSLTVNGSTNINHFSCVIAHYNKADTISIGKGGGNDAVSLKGALILDILDFDCHNRMMTGDLRKTLKQKDFPQLKVSFIGLSRYPHFSDPSKAIRGFVDIELAGVVKRIEVNYKATFQNAGAFTLVGTQDVNFSDFNIIPPSRLGGMIKTNQLLNVAFSLNIKTID
ncbi:MAG: YceI family protein [Mucilaginibacter sp.]|uniref:YceI family protein n=1 Tax=Mucilaginibacter sp. TaxID=1882438 RepID=UPI003263DA86